MPKRKDKENKRNASYESEISRIFYWKDSINLNILNNNWCVCTYLDIFPLNNDNNNNDNKKSKIYKYRLLNIKLARYIQKNLYLTK